MWANATTGQSVGDDVLLYNIIWTISKPVGFLDVPKARLPGTIG
jgi:hypothetical protein